MSRVTLQTALRRVLTGCLLLSFATCAGAVPSFARQTGLECMACHVSWPELTPTGRQFKLNGYTLGNQLRLPLAGMLQVSRTSTINVDPRSPDRVLHDRDIMLQQASIFYSGKVSEHAGVFSQFSYDGIEWHVRVDNVDLRYANRLDLPGHDLAYGLTLHNNPTVQDVYNTGAAWGFPYATSSVAVKPNALVAIENLGQQVAGLGAYALSDNTLYVELSAYRTGDQIFSPLRAGTDRASAAALRGYNPYWRLALQHDWDLGTHSAMIGTYGLLLDRYPDNTVRRGPVDHFRDVGIDAQYQYLTERHRVSAQFNYVRERQRWDINGRNNAVDTLRSGRFKLTYYFEKRYGATIAYFSTRGSADIGLYNSGSPIDGSATGSPNSAGIIVEANFLPKRDVRLLLQYTGYQKFNGARKNYDGFGRNAKDNNTLYLLSWWMF